jgi:alpha-L-rhamnosidase
MTNKFDLNAQWIGRAECINISWQAKVLPAPFFRKKFAIERKLADAEISICGLGYYELYINGRKVGDHVLDPVVTQYDKRVRYVVYDVAEYLVHGENVIGVILGNGWYNCHTAEVWHFDKASWRDYPKFSLGLKADNRTVLISDTTWKCSSGPIVFDGLRNGETYDARLELDGWLSPDYDDSTWQHVARVAPPGGILEEQTMPPCKVMQTIPYCEQWCTPTGDKLYDFGQNLTGWVRIEVSGDAGAELVIRYGERLKADRSIDQEHIGMYILSGDVQTDRYILKGSGEEIWEPRFTYHGFQYVQISVVGKAEIHQIEARFVYTSFEQTGQLLCANTVLNDLQECTLRSYRGNFTGIPTDCPHREKNGWTGDAQLAAETGLFNFNAASSYEHWIDSLADIQRPGGQLPGIAPSAGWGYNGAGGPAWDSALLLIPWYIYLYTGRTYAIKKHYNAMKKYVDYCSRMADDNIVSFGLGDWCHVDKKRIVDVALTSTAYYYVDALLIAKFAELQGHTEDWRCYTELAAEIKKAFNKRFYRGAGIYAKGEQTAMACALYQGLVDHEEKSKVVQKLVDAVNQNNVKPDFGILGAKYVPRALGENGYVALAYKLISQSDFPGWGYWLKQGATTLWENWNGEASRNHIMFGDISAWMYQYLAGIRPDPENPGFKNIIIQPNPVPGLKWVRATCKTPAGEISVSWKLIENSFKLDIELPEHITAIVKMPDETISMIKHGKHHLISASI